MRYVVRTSLAMGFILLLTAAAGAQSKSFKSVPNNGRDVVQFVSEATMEEIVGITSKVSAELDFDPADVLAAKTGLVEVDLNSLNSGLSMRDNDMKTKFLETEKFPKASFTLKKFVSAEKPKLNPGETTKAVVEGDFTIHGITKTYQIPVTLYYDHTNQTAAARLTGSKGDILAISSNFSIKLADHAIKRPEFLFLKLAEEQKVSVNIALTDQLP